MPPSRCPPSPVATLAGVPFLFTEARRRLLPPLRTPPPQVALRRGAARPRGGRRLPQGQGGNGRRWRRPRRPRGLVVALLPVGHAHSPAATGNVPCRPIGCEHIHWPAPVTLQAAIGRFIGWSGDRGDSGRCGTVGGCGGCHSASRSSGAGKCWLCWAMLLMASCGAFCAEGAGQCRDAAALSPHNAAPRASFSGQGSCCGLLTRCQLPSFDKS